MRWCSTPRSAPHPAPAAAGAAGAPTAKVEAEPAADAIRTASACAAGRGNGLPDVPAAVPARVIFAAASSEFTSAIADAMLSLLRAISTSGLMARGIGRSLISSERRGVTDGATAAIAAVEALDADATITRPVVTSGAGAAIRTWPGIFLNPRSISRATSALRAALDVPPMTATITRLSPCCAEVTRLNPAARV